MQEKFFYSIVVCIVLIVAGGCTKRDDKGIPDGAYYGTWTLRVVQVPGRPYYRDSTFGSVITVTNTSDSIAFMIAEKGVYKFPRTDEVVYQVDQGQGAYPNFRYLPDGHVLRCVTTFSLGSGNGQYNASATFSGTSE